MIPNKMKNKLLVAFLSLTIFVNLGAVAYAQTPPPGGKAPTSIGGTAPTGPIKLVNPFKGGDSLFALLKTIINQVLMPIGGILAVLAFIYTGFLYVMARGNPGSLKTAHQSLLYTAIGTAVLLGSWMLANVVCKTIQLLGGPACVA